MSLLAPMLSAAWLAANPIPSGPDEIAPARDPQAIYGGEEVEPGDWPAVVAVHTGKLCTGTLVAPDLILTAAHCFDPEPVGAVQIYFGDDLNSGQVVLSSEWGKHPDFCLPDDCGEDLHDFAWVRLATPANVQPIVPITEQGEFDEVMRVGTPLTFVGLGQDEDGAIGIKREVEASLTGFNESGREFRAGGDGKDTCYGDSGGPALVLLQTGEWRLAGVISRGGKCGEGGIYGVPLPELCWLRDSSGVDLLPGGCERCDCVTLVGEVEDEGCECSSSEVGVSRPWWLVVELGLILALVVARRRPQAALSR